MAADAEGRMNLAALKGRDPYITSIIDTSSQVAFYSFTVDTNQWEKTDIEGTLFIYVRSATPKNGLMILNRLGPKDYSEVINSKLEIEIKQPFIVFKNSKNVIFGIWFNDMNECHRIESTTRRLVHSAMESEALMSQLQKTSASHSSTDIIKMLSKAHDEYQQHQRHDIVKPTPVKASPGQIKLETLFKNADHQHAKESCERLVGNSLLQSSNAAHLTAFTSTPISSVPPQVLSPDSVLKQQLNILPTSTSGYVKQVKEPENTDILMNLLRQTSIGSQAQSTDQETLLSPEAFTGPAASEAFQTQPETAVGSHGEHASITPLTQDQLSQALIYLIKNDTQFMRKIHEAYVKSLHENLL